VGPKLADSENDWEISFELEGVSSIIGRSLILKMKSSEGSVFILISLI